MKSFLAKPSIQESSTSRISLRSACYPALVAALLLPVSGMHAQAAPEAAAAASCPIHVDEAYLTAESGTMPVEGENAKRTLHVSLKDTSGKQIVSYVVHARIALRPAALTTNEQPSATVTRKWSGALDPDTPRKEQWTFSADRFAMGLRRVWFDKVTFVDGTTWNKSADDRCSFAATGHVVQTKQP